jgi:hypothetical protein
MMNPHAMAYFKIAALQAIGVVAAAAAMYAYDDSYLTHYPKWGLALVILAAVAAFNALRGIWYALRD